MKKIILFSLTAMMLLAAGVAAAAPATGADSDGYCCGHGGYNGCPYYDDGGRGR